jgi:hypothetical protein
MANLARISHEGIKTSGKKVRFPMKASGQTMTSRTKVFCLKAISVSSNRGYGVGLPKMCGAMDGGAQALMDVLVAFLGSSTP